MVNLRYLYLGSNQINRLHKQLFQSFVKLQELSLGSNQINHLDKQLFQTLVKLKDLRLGLNQLKDLDKDLFQILVNHQTLSLKSNQINHLDKELFQTLAKLHTLGLGSNRIKFLDFGDDFFKRLDHLDASNNKLTKFKINNAPPSKTCILFNNKLNFIQINSISLKRLDISPNQIVLESPNFVTLKVNRNKIEAFDLRPFPLQNNSIQYLSFHVGLKQSLEKLHLSII